MSNEHWIGWECKNLVAFASSLEGRDYRDEEFQGILDRYNETISHLEFTRSARSIGKKCDDEKSDWIKSLTEEQRAALKRLGKMMNRLAAGISTKKPATPKGIDIDIVMQLKIDTLEQEVSTLRSEIETLRDEMKGATNYIKKFLEERKSKYALQG